MDENDNAAIQSLRDELRRFSEQLQAIEKWAEELQARIENLESTVGIMTYTQSRR